MGPAPLAPAPEALSMLRSEPGPCFPDSFPGRFPELRGTGKGFVLQDSSGGWGVGRGSGLVSLFSCLTVAILSRQPLSRQDRAHWGCPDTVCPWLQGDPQVW